MLIQLLADMTRNKKVIGDLITSPEKTLKKYPGITKKQAQHLKKRDLKAISDAVAAEVAGHFSKPDYSLMYIGVDLVFRSLSPNRHKINDRVDMVMVLGVNQAPLPKDIMSSVQFNRRGKSVDAKIKSTKYSKRDLTITITMSATFEDAGSYSANVKLWAKGNPKESAELPTGNIFRALTS
jgi:hypothetical protein